MAFKLPQFIPPDFTTPQLANAPDAQTAPAPKDGVAPENFHGTSIYPEYVKLGGTWRLAEESRMDCVLVVGAGDDLQVVEARRLKAGDAVVIGRTERGEDGIYMHVDCFENPAAQEADNFAFRTNRTRETAFSADYDNLYELLLHERDHGHILWVMGPAFSFDSDARNAMAALVEHGFVNGLLSGNALATHDLEAAYYNTALGVDIYTQKAVPNGHYHHLDVLNKVRACGSMEAFVDHYDAKNGIMYSVIKNKVPFVLTGSIRDDGPMPEVYADVYAGQDAMRREVRKATTVICLATQLHTIATGNQTPMFRMVDGVIRPVFIYTVDISEFALNKLADRGSLTATGLVTNAQDFVMHVARGVGALPAGK